MTKKLSQKSLLDLVVEDVYSKDNNSELKRYSKSPYAAHYLSLYKAGIKAAKRRGFFTTTKGILDPVINRHANLLFKAIKKSKEPSADLETKLYSCDVALNNTHSFTPFNLFAQYKNDDFKDSRYGIKFHIAIDPDHLDELPLLLGYLAGETDKHKKNMTFKYLTTPSVFEEWANHKKLADYNKENTQSGKHITVYFNDPKLAEKVMDELVNYRVNAAKHFYGSSYDNPSVNQFDKAYSRHEFQAVPHTGIFFRPYSSNRHEDGVWRNFKQSESEHSSLEQFMKQYFPTFVKKVEDLRTKYNHG